MSTGMGVFGKKSTPAGTTAEDADFASKAASMREAQDAQQLKTFTRWWNSVLKPRGVKIEDLVVEVSPGVNPIMLYEELSGTLVKKYSKKPPSRFQKLENQNIFLKALKEKGIRLVNIGAEDLVDSNRTLICGLTWTLILRYEIQKYGANESELLRWVAGRRRTRRRRVQRGCREGGVAWWEEEAVGDAPIIWVASGQGVHGGLQGRQHHHLGRLLQRRPRLLRAAAQARRERAQLRQEQRPEEGARQPRHGLHRR